MRTFLKLFFIILILNILVGCIPQNDFNVIKEDNFNSSSDESPADNSEDDQSEDDQNLIIPGRVISYGFEDWSGINGNNSPGAGYIYSTNYESYWLNHYTSTKVVSSNTFCGNAFKGRITTTYSLIQIFMIHVLREYQ